MKRIDITTGDGTLRTRIVGQGPPIVFVHGALVDGSLWDTVVAGLSDRFTCVVPEMPLGSHTVPLPAGADRSPRGHAERVARLIAHLDRGPVTLVGNDSGGAIAQLVAAHHPDRVAGLVLTNCDALDVFPPPAFAYLGWLARAPRLMALVARLLYTLPVLARTPTAYGWLSATRIDGAQLRAWLAPGLNPEIRRDVAGFFAEASGAVTLAAAERLRGFPGPIRLVWGRDDPFFTRDLAERLAATLPTAELAYVDARCYVPLDQPAALAAAVARLADRAEAPAVGWARAR